MPKRKLSLEQLEEKLSEKHNLQLERLKANPVFAANLEALKLLVKDPTFVVSRRNPDWWNAVKQFEERWRVWVLVRRKDDGRRYISLGPAGVRGQTDLRSGEVIITDPGYYGTSIDDMASLLKPVVRALQIPGARRTRYRVKTVQAIACKLKAEGKSLQEIAAKLYPDEYKAAMAPATEPNEATRARHLQLIIQYTEHDGISWFQAEKKAAAELGIDVRTNKAKVAKLAKRVRVLLRQK